MKKYGYCLLYGLILFIAFVQKSCIQPNTPFKPEEVKRRVLDSFPELRDTIDINVVALSENAENQWFVAYNKGQAFPRIFLYHTLKKQNPPIKISLNRPLANIEYIELIDVTYDGAYEMLIHLYYDYETSFQGKETVVIKSPFDTLVSNRKEIFNFATEQIWQKIDTFVDTMGLPIYQNRIENEVALSFYENYIVASGIIQQRPHRRQTFQWHPDSAVFVLKNDEVLHEAAEEQTHQHSKARLGGRKKLVQVVAHERNCNSFVVETVEGSVVDLPVAVREALLCADVASISPQGDYLIYADKKSKSVRYYHFGDNKIVDILPNLNSLEGISEVVWINQNQQLKMAFVVINPEEYLLNTRIYVAEIDKKGHLKMRFFDKKVWYQCFPRDGYCSLTENEDFKFNAAGNFVYRTQKTGDDNADFAVLELTTKKTKPQK